MEWTPDPDAPNRALVELPIDGLILSWIELDLSALLEAPRYRAVSGELPVRARFTNRRNAAYWRAWIHTSEGTEDALDWTGSVSVVCP